MPYQDTTLTPKQVAGNAAEDLASAHLERAGLRILMRNYRVRGGEIDCIALDGNTLVFVEVRLRRNTRFGGAAASIDNRKQQRIIHAARCYLLRYPRQAERPCRFDCVLLDSLNTDQLEWIKDAFQAD
jgi:putative endonuclease